MPGIEHFNTEVFNVLNSVTENRDLKSKYFY